MTRHIFIWIIGCFLASIGVVVILFAISRDLRQTSSSFLREFPPHPVLEGGTLNIKYTSYYIAGGTQHTVYLGNYESPLHLLVVDLPSLDTQYVSLNVKGVMDQKFWSAKVKVDSPYFYLTDGAVPRIYRGTTNTWYADRFPFDSTHYNDIVPINPDVYAVKTLGNLVPEQVIGRITHSAPHFRYNGTLLQKQIDGLFCTNGMLNYNKERNELIYLYYYRNEFIVVDTTLQLKFRANTIDNITKAQIKVATLTNEMQHVMAAPPLLVNRASTVSGRWLFVNSKILARNQAPTSMDRGSVIDVYDLENGQYQFSFYIYHQGGTKGMVEFRVFGGRMVVLYEALIQTFSLVPGFFRFVGTGETIE